MTLSTEPLMIPISESACQLQEQNYGAPTSEQLLARVRVNAQRTYCTIGNQALSLVEFEAAHEHIMLGEE